MMRDKEALLREMRQLKKSDQAGALAWWGTLSDEERGLVTEAVSGGIARVTAAMDMLREAMPPVIDAISRIADLLGVTE